MKEAETEKIVNNWNQKGLRLVWELLIAVTILLIRSVLFSRVTANIHVPCIFHVYIVRDAVPGVGILHYQQVLCLECFDSSEVTTRKGNE